MRATQPLLLAILAGLALGACTSARHAGAVETAASTAEVRASAASAAPAVASAPANAASASPSAAGPWPRPLLWKVSDADNSVYLLGSFHALKASDYPVGPAVDAAFADAEVVAFELAPEEVASPELALSMVAAATYTDGRSLREVVDPQTWSRLERYARTRNKDIAEFEPFEPWFVGLLISLSEMGRIGYDPEQGLDQQLTARAARENKRTLGLETGASQIAVLDGMGLAEQRQSLAEALDDAEVFKAQVDQLHSLWRNGDEQGLERLLIGDFRSKYPALYGHINVERNAAWAPKLQAMLDGAGSDDTLVVVGSMHLLGPDGVVSLLRAKGYRVERL